MPVSCPVCGRVFKDPQGRGGHLRHSKDSAHVEYRVSRASQAHPRQSLEAHPPATPSVPEVRSDSPVRGALAPLRPVQFEPSASPGSVTQPQGSSPRSTHRHDPRHETSEPTSEPPFKDAEAVDWSDPNQAATALVALSLNLAKAGPTPTGMSGGDKLVRLLIIAGVAAVALWILVRLHRKPPSPQPTDPVLQRHRPGTRPKVDPYWDAILGGPP